MSSSDSDDDMPLAQRAAQKVEEKPASNGAAVRRPAARKLSSAAARSSSSSGSSGSDSDSDSDSDSEDDVPLSQRTPQPKAGAKRKQPAAAAKKQQAKKQKSNSGSSTRPKSGGKGGGEPKWNTLVHSGVLFPPGALDLVSGIQQQRVLAVLVQNLQLISSTVQASITFSTLQICYVPHGSS
jgi:hypothetical protein